MQRAAATSSPSTPSTPSLPIHRQKRQRLSNGGEAFSSPVTPSDQELIQAALAGEEQKRAQAIERQAADAGETRWMLSIVEEPSRVRPGLNVVNAGFGQIDVTHTNHNEDDDDEEEDDDDEGHTPLAGRRIFGKFKDPDAVAPKQGSSEASSSESGSEDDEDDDPLGEMLREERRTASTRAREERREKKRREQAELERLAHERRKKDVKLNKITSISGGGNAGSPTGITCFACGQKGHTRKDCPSKSSGGPGRRKR